MPSKPRRPAKPPWTCPDCGRQFVSANRYHSCGRYAIGDHFAGKSPHVQALYEQVLAVLGQFGPVSAHALKTRIVLQAETQFAAVMPRKQSLELWLWLRRQARHPALRRVEMQVFRDYGHVFQLRQAEDLDEGLVALLHEAYLVGGRVLPHRP